MTPNNFLDELEALGISLIREAKMSATELSDKIQIFGHVVKWAAIKNKIDPDSGGEGSKIDDYRKQLESDSHGGGGDRHAREKGQKTSSGTASIASALPNGSYNRGRKRKPKYENPGDVDGNIEDTSPAFGTFPVADSELRAGDTDHHGPDNAKTNRFRAL